LIVLIIHKKVEHLIEINVNSQKENQYI
jgi:hypothetical protein